jgi:hypothetical protein
MALKIFNTGDVLAASDVNEYLVNYRFAIKGADTSRISNATLTNDPDLTLQLDANKTYHLELFIQYHGLPGADILWAFAAPATAALYGMAYGPDLTISGATGPYKTVAYSVAGVSITGSRSNGCRGVGTEDSFWCRGVIVNGGTSGSLTFRFCQNVSSATGTWVTAGSAMILRRVA